jgi:hypothetical protein
MHEPEERDWQEVDDQPRRRRRSGWSSGERAGFFLAYLVGGLLVGSYASRHEAFEPRTRVVIFLVAVMVFTGLGIWTAARPPRRSSRRR